MICCWVPICYCPGKKDYTVERTIKNIGLGGGGITWFYFQFFNFGFTWAFTPCRTFVRFRGIITDCVPFTRLNKLTKQNNFHKSAFINNSIVLLVLVKVDNIYSCKSFHLQTSCLLLASSFTRFQSIIHHTQGKSWDLRVQKTKKEV